MENNNSKKYCPYCGAPVKNYGAIFCEKCGKRLAEREVSEYYSPEDDERIVYHKNRFLAVLFSIFPGFGQFYNGQILKGLIFVVLLLFLVNIDYVSFIGQSIKDIFSWIYLVFYVYNFADAYINASNINRDNGNYFYNENLNNTSIKDLDDSFRGKFYSWDIIVSNLFHDVDANGKKTVSIWKIVLIFLIMVFINNMISDLLNIPDATW